MSILELEELASQWDISEICPVKVVESEVKTPVLPIPPAGGKLPQDLAPRVWQYRVC